MRAAGFQQQPLLIHSAGNVKTRSRLDVPRAALIKQHDRYPKTDLRRVSQKDQSGASLGNQAWRPLAAAVSGKGMDLDERAIHASFGCVNGHRPKGLLLFSVN